MPLLRENKKRVRVPNALAKMGAFCVAYLKLKYDSILSRVLGTIGGREE
jgi:hypothetical protein